MNKIAVLGPKNTFSDVCYKKFVEITRIELSAVYFKTVKQVVEAGSDIGYALLPFENTLEGYVQQHMDLLLSSDLKIDCELTLPIDFDFVYKKSFKCANLYVQYATKNQCLRFLEQHPELNITITDSNIESYDRYLKDANGAAIIPKHLSTDKAPKITSVTDEKQNHTRFLILSKKEAGLKKYHDKEEFKVSLVVTPFSDRPGLLFDILKAFSYRQVNLISIMSRPTKKQIGMYHFFIELLSDEAKYTDVTNVLDDLKNAFDLKVLGIYQVII